MTLWVIGLRIKHFFKGIKSPQTQITIEWTKAHQKEEEYEKKHFKFVPITQEELVIRWFTPT